MPRLKPCRLTSCNVFFPIGIYGLYNNQVKTRDYHLFQVGVSDDQINQYPLVNFLEERKLSFDPLRELILFRKSSLLDDIMLTTQSTRILLQFLSLRFERSAIFFSISMNRQIYWNFSNISLFYSNECEFKAVHLSCCSTTANI